jgi:hypothetical protein
MRRVALVAICTAVTIVAAAPARAASWPPTHIMGARLVYGQPFGRSVSARKLRVTAFGAGQIRAKVLVIGCIHGTECAGTAIADRVMARGCPPTDADIWLVPDLNPDGHRLGVRVNGRGVDLNRNFGGGWRPIGTRGDPQYSGSRPFSEPETRAARHLIQRVKPAVTIWYHQGQGPLVRAWGRSIPAARDYARRAGLPFRRMRWLAGTAPHWQNQAHPGTSSFVVELPDGRLSQRATERQARAVLGLARNQREQPAGVGGSAPEGR